MSRCHGPTLVRAPVSKYESTGVQLQSQGSPRQPHVGPFVLVSGPDMFLGQQLGTLGSRGSCWVSEPGCCRDEPCTHIRFVYSLVAAHLAQLKESRMSLLVVPAFVQALCECLICVASCVYVCMCLCGVCALRACACWEYIFSLLLVGPGDRELWQPCLS